METCFNYTQVGECYVSSDERKWINRILKLAEEHPDDVQILASPEKNDGCIYAVVPTKWIKVTPPHKRNLTDEQKDELRNRLATVRRFPK